MLQTESLLSKDESLKVEISSLQSALSLRDEQNKLLKEENSHLHEMLLEMKRHRFGQKSERWQSEEQLLFNEVEIESKKPDIDDEDQRPRSKLRLTKRRGEKESPYQIICQEGL